MADFYAASIDRQVDRLRALAIAALACWPGDYAIDELLKYRENAVFALRGVDGSRAVLRIHRHGYHSEQALHSELQWIAALEQAGVSVPRILPASNGALFQSIAHPLVPETRQIDMMEWIDGAHMGMVDPALPDNDALFRSLYREAGVLAARLHNQSERWTPPKGFQRHAWDADGLVGAEPLWGRFWELEGLTPAQVVLLHAVRDRARADLATYGADGRNYGLIHADFVPENLMHGAAGLRLIDFDDAGFGWHMFELATALYFYMDEPIYPVMREALFAGYRSLRPLGDEDEARLPLFLLLRSLTYLGWVHTRRETETAREMAAFFIERSCRLAAAYLAKSPVSVA